MPVKVYDNNNNNDHNDDNMYADVQYYGSGWKTEWKTTESILYIMVIKYSAQVLYTQVFYNRFENSLLLVE